LDFFNVFNTLNRVLRQVVYERFDAKNEAICLKLDIYRDIPSKLFVKQKVPTTAQGGKTNGVHKNPAFLKF